MQLHLFFTFLLKICIISFLYALYCFYICFYYSSHSLSNTVLNINEGGVVERASGLV